MATMTLDKRIFQTTLKVLGLRVEEPKRISQIVKALHGHLLNRPKLKNVIAEDHKQTKLILLNEKIQDPQTLSPLPKELTTFLLQQEKLTVVDHIIPLDYSYYPVDYILSTILPSTIEIPSSFETIGHIAHVNLREPHLPYKYIIGQVILDKNAPNIRTVVNKIENIETVFRTFPMEILAGEDNFIVQVHESKAIFQFNYKQVYWNSRLQKEHARLVQWIHEKELKEQNNVNICDMMCGIGPFAIPLGMHGYQVYANDLNPHSYKYLIENIALNHVQDQVKPYNMDAREFIRHIVNENVQFHHVIMNLPATAIEFLDIFCGIFKDIDVNMPWIHCYCFSNAMDIEKDIQLRVEEILGGELDTSQLIFHRVRDVAPKKVMVCLSFQLPQTIGKQIKEENEHKRRRLNDKDEEDE